MKYCQFPAVCVFGELRSRVSAYPGEKDGHGVNVNGMHLIVTVSRFKRLSRRFVNYNVIGNQLATQQWQTDRKR